MEFLLFLKKKRNYMLTGSSSILNKIKIYPIYSKLNEYSFTPEQTKFVLG